MVIRIHPLWIIVYLAYTAALLWGSLDSDPNIPDLGVFTWDKFLHAAAYGGLTILGGLSIRGDRWSPLPWILSAVIALGLGGVLEVAQAVLTRRRMGDWSDLGANALGILLALAAVAIFTLIRRKAHPGSQ